MTETKTARDEKVEGLEAYLQGYTWLMRDSELRPGWAFKSMSEAVLHHGRLAPAGPYTDDERTAILETLEALREPPEIKMCYQNATMLAHAARLADVDLQYAEGSCAVMIPIEHAWCVLPSGRPVDITLRTSDEYREADSGADADDLHNLERFDDEDVDPAVLLARAEHNLAEQAYWGYAVPYRERWAHLERVGRWTMVMEDPQGEFPLMRSKELPWA